MRAALHIAVLCAFALAQPLYDLLGGNADFFVAHRLGRPHLIGFAAALSLGVPVVLALVTLAAGRFGEKARAFVLTALVFLLVLATELALARAFEPLSGGAGIAGCMVVAAGLTWFYRRSSAAGTYLTWLSPAVVIFPLYFLLGSQVAAIVDAEPEVPDFGAKAARPAPIVFLLFDEFNVDALLDATGEIDRLRFPNFARLTDSAWWFPNAVATGMITPVAAPAILSGRLPSGRFRPATADNYPDNLFTRLAPEYELRVQEDITYLCPEALCPRRTLLGRSFELGPFVSDLAILYGHLLLDDRFTAGWLPAVDMKWRGFAERPGGGVPSPRSGAGQAGSPEREKAPGGARARKFQGLIDLLLGARPRIFQQFVDQIEPTFGPVLHFLHIQLPHDPYDYLPDGRLYNSGPMPGLLWGRQGAAAPKLPSIYGIKRGTTFRLWSDSLLLNQVAYHRYLFQIAYADALLGRLLDKLEETGLYDETLIVVAADHGISFRPGQPKRFLTDSNLSDLLHVPLWVKLPDQRDGRTSPRRVSGLDILPTIAETIGLSPPWQTEGQSMVAPGFVEPAEIRIATRTKGVLAFDPKSVPPRALVPWQVETFGQGVPMDRVAAKGPFVKLIGRRVADVADAGAQRELIVETEYFELLEGQGAADWRLPVVLDAWIEGVEPGSLPLPLAVAVNDVVVATTTAVAMRDERARVRVVVPPASFEEDGNDVALYHVHEGAPQPAGRRELSLHVLASGGRDSH